MKEKLDMNYAIVVIPTPLLCTEKYCASCKFKKFDAVKQRHFCMAFPTKAGHARVLHGTPAQRSAVCLNNTIRQARMVTA